MRVWRATFQVCGSSALFVTITICVCRVTIVGPHLPVTLSTIRCSASWPVQTWVRTLLCCAYICFALLYFSVGHSYKTEQDGSGQINIVNWHYPPNLSIDNCLMWSGTILVSLSAVSCDVISWNPCFFPSQSIEFFLGLLCYCLLLHFSNICFIAPLSDIYLLNYIISFLSDFLICGLIFVYIGLLATLHVLPVHLSHTGL